MGFVESSVSWIDQVLPPHLTLQDNFLSTSKHPTTDWAGLSERHSALARFFLGFTLSLSIRDVARSKDQRQLKGYEPDTDIKHLE